MIHNRSWEILLKQIFVKFAIKLFSIVIRLPSVPTHNSVLKLKTYKPLFLSFTHKQSYILLLNIISKLIVLSVVMLSYIKQLHHN